MNLNSEAKNLLIDNSGQSSPPSDYSSVSSSSDVEDNVTVGDEEMFNPTLVFETNTLEQLDEDVEEMLFLLAEEFIEEAMGAACKLTKHRKASIVETRDVVLSFERHYSGGLPGYPGNEIRPACHNTVVAAHRRRLSKIQKTVKKNRVASITSDKLT